MSKRAFVLIVAITISLVTLSLASPAPVDVALPNVTIDPCSNGVKSSQLFNISTGGFQEVIAGASGKQVLVCSIVFSASASSGLNVNFAGGSSGCSSGFTFFGTVYPTNNFVVSAGGGNSTQFTLPAGDSFCTELGGVTPLQANGWVTYVIR